MIESRPKIPHGIQKDESAGKFHFWLIVTMLAVFILLLFYSQKVQGLM